MAIDPNKPWLNEGFSLGYNPFTANQVRRGQWGSTDYYQDPATGKWFRNDEIPKYGDMDFSPPSYRGVEVDAPPDQYTAWSGEQQVSSPYKQNDYEFGVNWGEVEKNNPDFARNWSQNSPGFLRDSTGFNQFQVVSYDPETKSYVTMSKTGDKEGTLQLWAPTPDGGMKVVKNLGTQEWDTNRDFSDQGAWKVARHFLPMLASYGWDQFAQAFPEAAQSISNGWNQLTQPLKDAYGSIENWANSVGEGGQFPNAGQPPGPGNVFEYSPEGVNPFTQGINPETYAPPNVMSGNQTPYNTFEYDYPGNDPINTGSPPPSNNVSDDVRRILDPNTPDPELDDIMRGYEPPPPGSPPELGSPYDTPPPMPDFPIPTVPSSSLGATAARWISEATGGLISEEVARKILVASPALGSIISDLLADDTTTVTQTKSPAEEAANTAVMNEIAQGLPDRVARNRATSDKILGYMDPAVAVPQQVAANRPRDPFKRNTGMMGPTLDDMWAQYQRRGLTG